MITNNYFKIIIYGRKVNDEGLCDLTIDFDVDWDRESIIGCVADAIKNDDFFREIILSAGAIYLMGKNDDKFDDFSNN